MNVLNSMAVLLFGILFSGNLIAQNENWTLEKEKDGIRISSRPAEGSSFKDIRVEVDVPGNIDQLSAILLDIPGYTNWAYATKKSVLIKDLGQGKLIYYSEVEVPWPATNRYYYAQLELKKNPADRSMILISANLPEYTPVPKDLIKVPYSKGEWKVTTISKKSIHIDYILQLNPGGSLPAWVLNLFSTKGPMETFENVKHKMTVLNQ
jgi:START domain